MLNISDILDDPDFIVPLVLERRTEKMDEYGRASHEGTRLEIMANIQPLSPKELERLPEADRNKELLVVYSRSMIRGTGPGIAPDVIFWQGRPYEVSGVEAWPGWWRATIQPLPEDYADGE